MLKFEKFNARSGEFETVKPLTCNFGISALIGTAIAGLAADAGVGAATAATIGSIAGPALVGSGLGAAGSALMGGNIGQGALLGGLGGALGPSLSAMGIGGPGAGAAGGALAGAGASTPISVPGADGNTLATDLNYSTPSLAGAAGTPSAAAGTTASALSPVAKGINAISNNSGGAIPGLGMGTTLGVLAALAQNANRPTSTRAPAPPGSTTPWNPTAAGTLNRTTNPFVPATGSYYTYGQAPEPQFFNNNALSFTPIAMAKGGALRHAMRGGHYAGGGQSYVHGDGGGQDDDVDARLSDGEYVMDASTVSRLGDGNNNAGARKLDEMRHLIANDAGSPRVVQKKTHTPLSYLREVA